MARKSKLTPEHRARTRYTALRDKPVKGAIYIEARDGTRKRVTKEQALRHYRAKLGGFAKHRNAAERRERERKESETLFVAQDTGEVIARQDLDRSGAPLAIVTFSRVDDHEQRFRDDQGLAIELRGVVSLMFQRHGDPRPRIVTPWPPEHGTKAGTVSKALIRGTPLRMTVSRAVRNDDGSVSVYEIDSTEAVNVHPRTGSRIDPANDQDLWSIIRETGYSGDRGRGAKAEGGGAGGGGGDGGGSDEVENIRAEEAEMEARAWELEVQNLLDADLDDLEAMTLQ